MRPRYNVSVPFWQHVRLSVSRGQINRHQPRYNLRTFLTAVLSITAGIKCVQTSNLTCKNPDRTKSLNEQVTDLSSGCTIHYPVPSISFPSTHHSSSQYHSLFAHKHARSSYSAFQPTFHPAATWHRHTGFYTVHVTVLHKSLSACHSAICAAQIAEWHVHKDLCNKTAIPGFSVTFQALTPPRLGSHASSQCLAGCRAFNPPTINAVDSRVGTERGSNSEPCGLVA